MALRRHRRDLAEISTTVLPWPEWWTPSLAWEDLSAVDRRALTEMLVDKIVIERHPSKIDRDGRRHDNPPDPYQDPEQMDWWAPPWQDHEQEAERLKAVHEARVEIVPRV